MGRYYKIILSLVIAIFMVTGTISAYEGTDVNLISVTNLLKKTQDVKSKKINLCNLKIDKEGHTNLCVQDVATSDNKSINKNEDVAEEETQAVMSLSDEQLNLLSKLVAAEARGESYEGQVAVAAVVLNRVKDSRFPDSIEGVIYQKNAFSVVRDGYIDAQPTEESYKAAKDALYGSDPTNDAIYFWNPDISTCNWINTLNPHLRIGNHVFAR
ncbi:cell wall hydrolase [Intestinibacter sp.]|uniref:cell wall hydrolase n=1 Tax=Intestinibacter sp. TaxID=1965304 RepID=UPI002A91D1D0|nr:cell wall hydrolase [Intestinibacter sp.]MDY5211062.1 cell wall hydrolase [Intestinibacter sp.]